MDPIDSLWTKLSLESRRMLIELMLEQEHEVREIFTDAVDDIKKEIERRTREGTAEQYLQNIDVHLINTATDIEERLEKVIDAGLSISIEAGAHQSRQATLSVLNKANIDWEPIERNFFRSNQAAVGAMKNRTIKGLNLSDRIWEKGAKTRQTLGEIIQAAIAEGEHPTRVARMLEDYVRNGANTFAVNYPNMMKRIGSLPMDLSYEALRLARTEMASAYGEATKRSAKLSPATEGIRWTLSNAGVSCDVCKGNADHDSGLGRGVYRVDDLPEYPAHPNCLCVLITVNIDTDDLIDRLIEWNKKPGSHPDIERWYQNVYKRGVA